MSCHRMIEQQVRGEILAKIVTGDLPEVVVAGLRRCVVRRLRDVPLDRSYRDREQWSWGPLLEFRYEVHVDHVVAVVL